MPGTTSDAVDQGECPAAMDPAHRVEQMLPRLAFEDGEAIADFGDPERHGLRDGRLRQLAGDDGLQDLLARLASDLGRGRQAVFEASRRLHVRWSYCMYVQIMSIHIPMNKRR